MNKTHPAKTRRGTVLALAPAMIVLICVIEAFAVDLGYVTMVRSQLQSAADGASMMGAVMLRDDGASGDQVVQSAIEYAQLNDSEHGSILVSNDVQIGVWDFDAETFTPNAPEPNAVRVTIRRDGQNSGNVSLFFSRIFGTFNASVATTALAAFRIETDPEGDVHKGLPAFVQ